MFKLMSLLFVVFLHSSTFGGPSNLHKTAADEIERIFSVDNLQGYESTKDRVARILSQNFFIDGHNDLAWEIRKNGFENEVETVPLEKNLTKIEPWASSKTSHTDLRRLKKGKISGQFWAAYVPCRSKDGNSKNKDAVKQTLEQIEVIRKFVKKYPDQLQWADSADDIEKAFKAGKIASLMGVEGGHSIGTSLDALRTLYKKGARYMTLTHICNTPWADAAQSETGIPIGLSGPGKQLKPESNGLSSLGIEIVLEMNKLGMIVDISHVSRDAMVIALNVTKAPVIFSHSGARGVYNHARNVPDDVLEMVKGNGGIVMVTFVSEYLSEKNYNTTNGAISDVVKHINYIRKVAGVDHVGIGADYNGVPKFPIGLEDVSKYPKLFEALAEDKEVTWSDEDLIKLAGGNLMRVFKQVEKVRDNINVTMQLGSRSLPLDPWGK